MKLLASALFVCLFVTTGCGVFGDIEQTRDEVVKTNDGIGKTNESVRQQTLLVALKELKNPENTDSVYSDLGQFISAPVKMFPYAKTFADNATALEIMQICHTYITDAQKAYNSEEKGDKQIKQRLISLTAAGAIAAFTSDEKLKEIFAEQLDRGGEFQDSAYALAFVRYTFIRDYLLNQILDQKRTANIELLRAASEYYNDLKFLANSPYASKFKFTNDPNDPDKINNAPGQLVVLEPEKLALRLKLQERLSKIVLVLPEGGEDEEYKKLKKEYDGLKKAYDAIMDKDLFADYTDQIDPSEVGLYRDKAKSKFEVLKTPQALQLLKAFE